MPGGLTDSQGSLLLTPHHLCSGQRHRPKQNEPGLCGRLPRSLPLCRSGYRPIHVEMGMCAAMHMSIRCARVRSWPPCSCKRALSGGSPCPRPWVSFRFPDTDGHGHGHAAQCVPARRCRILRHTTGQTGFSCGPSTPTSSTRTASSWRGRLSARAIYTAWRMGMCWIGWCASSGALGSRFSRTITTWLQATWIALASASPSASFQTRVQPMCNSRRPCTSTSTVPSLTLVRAWCGKRSLAVTAVARGRHLSAHDK